MGIYRIKDQWSSYVLHLVVVPNNRLATTVGHIHLDCIGKYLSELFLTFSYVFWVPIFRTTLQPFPLPSLRIKVARLEFYTLAKQVYGEYNFAELES